MIETIRKDILAARKERDVAKATLLNTLVSDITTKDAKGHIDDSTSNTIRVIKKYLVGIEEVLSKNPVGDMKVKMEREREILSAYLPKELSKDMIQNEMNALYGDEVLTVKDTKRVVADLEGLYPNQISGKLVSEILRGV